MIRKLVFALTYTTFVFLISRLVDVVIKSYELKSISLLPVRVVLDPGMLSVSNLKAVLENRGISYSGLVEKRELQALIHASGDITDEELHIHSRDSHSADPDVSELTSGSHFYELVEDTKDSAWIVIVVPLISGIMALNRVSEEWKEVVRKTSKFGIRAAIFDCRLDPEFCESRQWTSARLLLAVPSEYSMKKPLVLIPSSVSSNI
jgi:E3 ubiquitin-protein ligase RNF103